MKKVGITLGDPAGIGPEITLRALVTKRMGRKGLVIIGSREVLEKEARRYQNKPWFSQSWCSLRDWLDANVIDIGSTGSYEMGRVQKNCGQAALRALEVGVELLRRDELSGLVTAPVSKEALHLVGFEFPGQTEFLAARLGRKSYAMLAWSPWFKVVLVTIHLPITRVTQMITPARVQEKMHLLDEFLRQEMGGSGVRAPRIAVLALNPHGDEFTLGEEKRIRRAINQARRQGLDVAGPFPADAIFSNRGRFDGFVAMYHDQAMIPAKMLSKGKGVNVTLGLGRVRTSPLHGVAFDIAGRGIASADSMIAAIKLARRLCRDSRS